MNVTRDIPFRLRVARLMRYFPPLGARRLASVIFSQSYAVNIAFEYVLPAQTGSLLQSTTSDRYSGYPFSMLGYNNWRLPAIALAVTPPSGTIIEVGANIGTETVGFADVVGCEGTVLAFEPFPPNIKSIENTLKLQICDTINLLPYAVGNYNGQITFATTSDSTKSGQGYIVPVDDKAAGYVVQSIEVPIVILDSLDLTHYPIHAIFVDAEGAEVKVLQGAQQLISRNRPLIVVEAQQSHLERNHSDQKELYELLNYLGYEVYNIGRFGLTRDVKYDGSVNSNWLGLHQTKSDQLQAIKSSLRHCGIRPAILGLNPLVNLKQRR